VLEQFKAVLASIVFIAYPAIIYFLISSGFPWLSVAIVVGLLLSKFRHRSDNLLMIGGLLLLIVVSGYVFGPAFISKMAPLMIHLTLFSVFWGSLKTTPLINRFARLDFPVLPPEIETYCRKLTVLWAVFFAMNVLICIALALYDDHRIWMLYNGLIVYLLIGVLVVGEYLWRRIRFSYLEIPSFWQSIRKIVKNSHKIWENKEKQIERAG